MTTRPTGLIVVALVVSGLAFKPYAQGIRTGAITEPPRPALLTETTQDKKPDFSGLWTMTSPEAGHQILIKHDVTTFSYGPPAGEQGPMVVIKLDGTESTNKLLMGTQVSTAMWKGNQLQITSHVTATTGQTLEQVMLFFFDANGQLTMTVTNNGQDPTTMLYKKSS